jgi:N-sulfoglucosamine sulfohydrolase
MKWTVFAVVAASSILVLPALKAARADRAPLTATGKTAAPVAAKPNIVVFITDDESWQERSAYGWSKIPTPNFDRVARDGVLFTRGYTSAPSCAPSRAALLTGRNFWELEEGAFIQAWLPAKFVTLPDWMEAAGYHAGATAKGWGPGVLPPQSGRTRNPAGDAYNRIKRPTHEAGINDLDYPANFAKFLDERPEKKPFWFWIGSSEPHAPHGAENYRKLKEKYGVGLEDITVPGFLPDTPGVRRHRANMLYEICRVDEDLGRVLKVLEERGELANTLLIVTADNGTEALRSKTNVHDWGLRVPLAMMWPARVKGGRRVDDFVNFIDLAPTMLQAAGLTVPREMTGRSVLDVLLSDKSGRVDPARSWTVGGLEWHGERDPVNLAGRTIRDERYQYIINYGPAPRRIAEPSKQMPDADYVKTAATGDEIDLVTKHPNHPAVKPFMKLLVDPRPREELYDCEADPWQLNNLADSPAHAVIKARLKAQLEAYQRKTQDPRITGEMEIFEKTRAFVLNRKFGKGGYAEK